MNRSLTKDYRKSTLPRNYFERKTLHQTTRYLSDDTELTRLILNLRGNVIIDKQTTGMGMTHALIESDGRNMVIVEPTVSVIEKKRDDFEHRRDCHFLYQGSGTGVDDIEEIINSGAAFKLITTPDQLHNLYKSHYATYLQLITNSMVVMDEIDTYIIHSTFRDKMAPLLYSLLIEENPAIDTLLLTSATMMPHMVPAPISEKFRYYHLRYNDLKMAPRRNVYVVEGNLKEMTRRTVESDCKGIKMVVSCNNPKFPKYMYSEADNKLGLYCGEKFAYQEPYFRKGYVLRRQAGDPMTHTTNVITSRYMAGYDILEPIGEMHIYIAQQKPDALPYNVIIQAIGRPRNGCEKYFIWRNKGENTDGLYFRAEKKLIKAEKAFIKNPTKLNLDKYFTAFCGFAEIDTLVNLEARLYDKGIDTEEITSITRIGALHKKSFREAAASMGDISEDVIIDRAIDISKSIALPDKQAPSLVLPTVSDNVKSLYQAAYLDDVMFGREFDTNADRATRLQVETVANIQSSGLIDELPYKPTFKVSYNPKGRPDSYSKLFASNSATQRIVAACFDDVMSNQYLRMKSADERVHIIQNAITTRDLTHNILTNWIDTTSEDETRARRATNFIKAVSSGKLLLSDLQDMHLDERIAANLQAYRVEPNSDVIGATLLSIIEATKQYNRWINEAGEKFRAKEWLWWLRLSERMATNEVAKLNSIIRARTFGIEAVRFEPICRGFREYDYYTNSPKELRLFTAMQTESWDLAQFAPTLVNAIVGVNHDVYAHVMKVKGCSRPASKRIANKTFNLGYHWKKSNIKRRMIEVLGYTDSPQLDEAIECIIGHKGNITKRNQFYLAQTEAEKQLMGMLKDFIPKSWRLHDSVVRAVDQSNPIDVAAIRAKVSIDGHRFRLSGLKLISTEELRRIEAFGGDEYTYFKLSHEMSPNDMELGARNVIEMS